MSMMVQPYRYGAGGGGGGGGGSQRQLIVWSSVGATFINTTATADRQYPLPSTAALLNEQS